jgi:hypothetical protein
MGARLRSVRSVALSFLLAAACSAPGVLVAENGEHRLVARDRQTGVTMVITTGVWPGDAQFAAETTIVHTLVANEGSQPILLAPGDIELRDIRGFKATLLDTGATFERVGSPQEAEAYDRGYERNYDPGTFSEFEQIVVHEDIARQALPWGVLEPGTQMRGFLYFEPATRTMNEARLVWHVTTPDHTPLADLVFELFVAR